MHLIESTKPTVLLVDDCRFTRRAIFNAIESAMPECNVVCVPTLMAAQAAGAEIRVDLFIVDSSLPDGSGIDFLADMLMVHDQAPAILLADGALPKNIQKYGWFNGVHVLRKAVNRGQLIRVMRELLGDRGGKESVSSKLVKPLGCARLQEIPAKEILYRKIDQAATGILEFVGHGDAGVVYLLKGRVTYAESRDSIGEEALCKMLTWSRGYVFELPPEPERPSKKQFAKSDAAQDDETTDARQLNNVSNVVADEVDDVEEVVGLRASSNY